MSDQLLCPQCLGPIERERLFPAPYTHECGYRMQKPEDEVINLAVLSNCSEEVYTVEKLKNISQITGMSPYELYKLAIHILRLSGHDLKYSPCPQCHDGWFAETWFKVNGKKRRCCLNCGAHT